MKKKVLALMMAGVCLLAGCQSSKTTEEKKKDEAGNVVVEQLNIAFSPYADSDTILTQTEPLEELLKKEMKKQGYEVKNINMTVGTSYSAVGEALSAGTADFGFISGGTYTLYDSDCEVLLTALRYAINKDSDKPSDWNDGTIEENTDEMSTYYRSVFVAGPSKKGQELIEKVNAGEELTWEDFNSAKWAVMSPASASGYMYPCLWLQEKFGKGIQDLSNVVESDSYTTSLARLASGQVDIIVAYGHVRTKYASEWQTTLGGTDEMVKQTGIIGVTEPIFNDTISYSKTSTNLDEDLCKAFGQAMIDLAKTEEGKEIISVFSQTGYQWGKDSDYDGERKVQKMLKENQ